MNKENKEQLSILVENELAVLLNDSEKSDDLKGKENIDKLINSFTDYCQKIFKDESREEITDVIYTILKRCKIDLPEEKYQEQEFDEER